MNAGRATLVHAGMQNKRSYYNAKSPEAWSIFRVVVLPTELVMGLLIALQGAKPVTE